MLVDANALFGVEYPPLIVNDLTFTTYGASIVVFIMEEERGIIAFEVIGTEKLRV